MKPGFDHAPAPLAVLVFCAMLSAACTDGGSQAVKAGTAPEASASRSNSAFIQVEPAGTRAAPDSGPIPGRVTFRPEALLAIDTPASGRVLSVDVRPGDRVKAGATLLILQSVEAAGARVALQQASARAEVAAELLRRQDEMLARGIGLEVERLEAALRLREARSELERARRAAAMIGDGRSDRIALRAPHDAVVAAVKATVGAIVEPNGGSLVELADPARLWIVADVPEGEVSGIAEGHGAVAHLPGADARIEGVVTGVGSRVDPETRRVPVYITPSGKLPQLTPGMLAEVLLSGQGSPVLSLPVAAVLIKGGTRRIVYVQATDGRFEPRTVRTGRSRAGQVVILEGIEAGEPVVVRGALLLDGEAEQLL
jgi:cobalt-zinc-cadmium efflux system membrane fusion protein